MVFEQAIVHVRKQPVYRITLLDYVARNNLWSFAFALGAQLQNGTLNRFSGSSMTCPRVRIDQKNLAFSHDWIIPSSLNILEFERFGASPHVKPGNVFLWGF